jgi:hypothetical protein
VPSSVPPPPPAVIPGGGTAGYVPASIGSVWYNAGLNILLTIVTCFVWAFLWTYHTSEDLKKRNGDGLGGVIALVILFVFSPIIYFTIPNEIKNMYERDGREPPVTAIWGLWVLLPIIGNFIWYLKVQRVLNEFWLSKGALPA